MIGKIKGSYTIIGNINNKVVIAYSSTAVEPWVVWHVDTDGNFYSDQYACHYSLDTGELRGCPAGRGCHHYDSKRYIAKKFEKMILTEPS